MTVRRRISLLVAAAGFAASLFFSVAVFLELVEQPFHLLDEELAEEASRAARAVAAHLAADQAGHYPPEDDSSHCWIKVFDATSGRVYYRSALAKTVDLVRIDVGESRTVRVTLPPGALSDGKTVHSETTFRAKTFPFDFDGNRFLVQIACTMGKLREEIRELALSLIAGLVLSSLVLIVISHYIAGKILQPIGVMKALATDISEKNLDQRLPVGPENDEFNELAATINHMLDRLQHSFERQRNFLFDTSHELKTPLTTMRLAVDEVCGAHIEQLPEGMRENVLRLNEQIRRMDRLVKDLLNLSALEMVDSIESKPLSPAAILEPLVDEYRFLAEARGIRIDLRLPALGEICGDAEKLTRAFSNILDNAIKYNIAGGTIAIEGTQDGGRITVSVTNTGPGVADTDIDKVFDQFFRVERSRSTEHGGSGLGLAIVKRIVTLHKGDVRMESRPGEWTRVSVSLPLMAKAEKTFVNSVD